MKLSSLKLSVKALSLVSILLLVEMLFVGSYFSLLTKAEEEAAKQEKAKMIIARTNNIINSLFEGGFNIQLNVFHKEQADLSKYTKARTDVPNDISWLREQVRSDPKQLRLLERIDERTTKTLAMLEKMKTVSDTEAQMVAVNYALKLRTKVQKQMEGLVEDLIDFMNIEKKIESETPTIMKHHRDYLRWLLLGALFVNILAAIMLALLFVRSITSRLAVVVENSDRLRTRASLRSPLSGNDEIAQLDRAFHEMSNSLRGEEELIKASQLQLHAMIDQMPIGLMIIADNETIEYSNPTLERLLHSQDEELVGTLLSDHFFRPGPNPARFDQTSTVNGVIDLIGRKSDGSEVNVEFSVVDVSLASLARRLAIVIDVTERHEVEKLRQVFVSMVSHDLRTPLTSVSGFLQLLPMGVYGQIAAPAINEANVAEGQVEQLILLINDLLDLEKLEAGKLELSRTKVSLEDVIDAGLDTVFGLAELRGVELIFEGCEVDVIGDSERLKQAISKMLASVIRLSSSGDTLDVIVEPGQNSKAVQIAFKARRLSLPADKLSTIFEPFQRLEIPSWNGTLGLGLTLARAIAVQHGGVCGAECGASGGGTTLWLQLPS
ncbi:hypothetical protein BH10CYA1_BH10CYA1_47590 [soil metagenome]